ncbi:hypothetical protein [Amnibacterium sp.]|uniref:hypothetical protein n=1 Tax=Amnibacterium sp. TaxID=1872496 RepID=UPI003F7BAA45
MIACGTCGDSSSIDIVRDGASPWERPAEQSGARWDVSCGGCGATWTLVDEADQGTDGRPVSTS